MKSKVSEELRGLAALIPPRCLRGCTGSTLWVKELQNVSGPAGVAVIVTGCQRT